jgi:hypothetical protein
MQEDAKDLVDIARTAAYALGDLSFREFRVTALGLTNERSQAAFPARNGLI